MGVKLLILYVICQVIITTTLGRVTVPISDSIGKVTPIKPKALPTSAVSSSVTKSSLTCDSKAFPKSTSSPVKGSVTREFSSPLALISSSRALPVPKIESSIENVKIPERLREKFLSLFKGSIKNAKTGSRSKVSLPYKNPFLSSPKKVPNASPSNVLSDVYTAPLNKLSPLPSINSLPHVPPESLMNGFSSSPCKANKFIQPPTFKSTLSMEARTPSFSEQFTSNTFDSLCSSLHPLHYKSPLLPGVKTPSEPLINRPFPYKGAGKYNFPSQSNSQNSLGPKTPIFETCSNAPSGRNDAIWSPSFASIKPTEILKPDNPIQLPISPSNIPTVSSAQNGNKIWSSKEACTSPASVAFESKLEPPKSALPSISLKGEQDPISSLPYSWAGRTSDIKLKPCSLPVIKPPTFIPRNPFINPPKKPVVPISSSSPIVHVLSNKISSFDLENIGAPNLFPIIGVRTETIENITPNDLDGNHKTCFDSNSLEKINLRSPYSYQECVPLKYSPPIIPTEPIPTIYYGSSSFSPITYSASRISQTPVSYIPQPPSSSVAQATSNMVSSITNIVSDVVQNIVSSYKSNISSAPQNVPHIPTYKTQSDPYTDIVLIPDETLSVLSVLPFSQNPVNTISKLPEVSAPAVSDSATVKLLDSPCQSSAFEVTSTPPLFIPLTHPTATIVPTTSLITFSSPPICPSYLPSPTLPSYPVISSPIYMEAPIFKKKSSKKDSEAEKIIELMLLAEILNNDETFDWDDLDTLLAFLSLS